MRPELVRERRLRHLIVVVVVLAPLALPAMILFAPPAVWGLFVFGIVLLTLSVLSASARIRRLESHESPVAVVARSSSTPPDLTIRLASPAARLSAWVIDAVIFSVAVTPLNPAAYSSRPSASLVGWLLVPAMLLVFGVLVAFDGGSKGATPGKRILRIRVADGIVPAPIGYRRAALRRLVYVLGGLPFYLGWLWIFVDRHRRAWHDLAARSIVVQNDLAFDLERFGPRE